MLVNEIIREAYPDVALKKLLRHAVQTTQANSGRLFTLSLSDSAFSVYEQIGRDDQGPSISLMHLDSLRKRHGSSDRAPSAFEQVILSKSQYYIEEIEEDSKSRLHSKGAQSRVLMPVLREDLCIGVIDLDAEISHHFQPEHLTYLQLAAGFASLLFEKKQVLRFVTALHQSFDYKRPFDQFVDDLVQMAVEALDVPYLVIREYVDNHLNCLGYYGFEGANKSTYDLEDLERYPSFLSAIATGETIVESNLRGKKFESLRNRHELRKIRSFAVAPIFVREEIFGTLSIAMECEYQFAELEKRGMQVVADAIGVIICNYRNALQSDNTLLQIGRTGALLTAVEVAQAVRHESLNLLSNASSLNAQVRDMCNSSGRLRIKDVNLACDQVDQRLVDINVSLNKIKQITKPLKREIKTVSLKELWQDTFAVVIGRMAELAVTYRIDDRPVAVEAYPDHLLQAFLNLILNSIDAYKEMKRKRGREIRVVIEKPSQAAKTVSLRYCDNAGGIDFAHLPAREDGTPRPLNDIFEPNVTTKDEGSGFGLYLVRRILDDHKGSIELIDNRGGVTFDITLPKKLE